MVHAFGRSAVGFGLARIALGLGEDRNYPTAMKTVAEWFPKKREHWQQDCLMLGQVLVY
jgi:ACS family hexuronate transporter-like MFS transporter